MGLALGILGILAIGYLVSKQRVQRWLLLLEMPFTNLPVVKSIYSSLKSFADYFSPSAKTSSQQVVILRMPGNPLELVGPCSCPPSGCIRSRCRWRKPCARP
ncbi:membrane protein [Bordetella pertussis]|nr:membrane protein [Bordetella pertussis]